MSKFVDALSAPSSKTELDLFTVPPTQVAVRRSFWSEVQLQNPCTNEGPYEFHISPDMFMLDLSKNFIYFTVRIVKSDGSLCQCTTQNDTLTGNVVGPINLLGKTLFKQIKIYLNGKLISASGDRYAYRAYFETELNYGNDAKELHVQAAGYTFEFGDTEDIKKNEGAKNRVLAFKDSQWVDLMAPIHADLFMQERFLLNQCDLKIEIYRNSDAFCFQNFVVDGAQYKLETRNMALFMKKVQVADNINLAIESMLQTTSAKYPIRRCHITSMYITENRRSTPLNSLFSGPLPRRLVVGLVAASAARGDLKQDPFKFTNFGLNEIKITSGSTTVPTTPYKLNFGENKYLRTCIQMFEGLGIGTDNRGNMISREHFLNHSTIFVFDLSPDGTDGTYWELIKEGTTTLQLEFDQNIPVGGIEAIIYAEFDSLLMIDKNRETYMDYSI